MILEKKVCLHHLSLNGNRLLITNNETISELTILSVLTEMYMYDRLIMNISRSAIDSRWYHT
jgi:hypothetical protein